MKRGYKVTDVKREKKIGVAAESLVELIAKSCKKLGVSPRFFVYESLFFQNDVFLASLSCSRSGFSQN